MVAGDLIVQVPPHPLNWVCLRRVGRQVVQHDPMAPMLQVLPQPLGGNRSLPAWRSGGMNITWRVGRQVVQHDPMAPMLQVLPQPLGGIRLC
jgi:hypothetical protein